MWFYGRIDLIKLWIGLAGLNEAFDYQKLSEIKTKRIDDGTHWGIAVNRKTLLKQNNVELKINLGILEIM